MEGRLERSKQMVALQEQLMTIAEGMDFAQRKMRDLTSGTSKIERDAVVVVDKVQAGAGKVRLNYLVGAAAWRPQYKFRAGKDDTGYPDDVFRLRTEVKEAEGVILGTPEYHGSFSGVLKNALDLMGFDEFEGKMIGLVGVSGGRMGACVTFGGMKNVSPSRTR